MKVVDRPPDRSRSNTSKAITTRCQKIFVRKHVGVLADWRLRIRHLALAPIALLLFSISLNRLAIAKWVGRVAQALRSTP